MATYSYYGSGGYSREIEVKKGSPTTAKYAIFYAVDDDPVIFCKNKTEMKKELVKLNKKKSVDKKSIKVFQLVNDIKK